LLTAAPFWIAGRDQPSDSMFVFDVPYVLLLVVGFELERTILFVQQFMVEEFIVVLGLNWIVLVTLINPYV
jgi:hypothetical protein